MTGEHRDGSTGVNQELTVREDVTKEQDKLHCSGTPSETVYGTGSEDSSEKLAGWKGSSTCRNASFPTPGRVSYISELYLHASCGSSRDLERMENRRTKLG